MHILFFGSGEFGLPTLKQLSKQHEIVGVVTSPDRPAGRKRQLTSTPIGKWAADAGLSLIQSDNVNTPEMLEQFAALQPDAIVVIAFGQKLSEKLVGSAYTINLHASLLPKWRGAAPINAAILHGDEIAGLSVITLAQKMDAGKILGQLSTPIDISETAGELHDRLAELGPDLVMHVLQGERIGRDQDEAEVTYAPKLSRDDAVLNLSNNAIELSRKIRGFSPWPGCHLTIAGVDCKIIRAIPKEGSGVVGELLEDASIAVGQGSIEILELKPAGSKTMRWRDFCNGRSIQTGDICVEQT